MMKGLKVLFVPITAQPPTFGMVMSIRAIKNDFDKIIICVRDNPILIKTDIVLKMLSFIFDEPKFKLISHECDFSTVHEIPIDLPEFNYMGTIDDRTHANLTAKGFVCIMLPKAIGYDEVFHRSAFRQSQTLELLRLKMTAISYNKMRASIEAGGDDEE